MRWLSTCRTRRIASAAFSAAADPCEAPHHGEWPSGERDDASEHRLHRAQSIGEAWLCHSRAIVRRWTARGSAAHGARASPIAARAPRGNEPDSTRARQADAHRVGALSDGLSASSRELGLTGRRSRMLFEDRRDGPRVPRQSSRQGSARRRQLSSPMNKR
jgi:hypothetical protein